ncbi:MAG: hypothetical protein PVF59_11775, partial [Desulfobacterales bacterium]
MRAQFDDAGVLDHVGIELEKVSQQISGANERIHLMPQGYFERVGPGHSNGLEHSFEIYLFQPAFAVSSLDVKMVTPR